MAELIRCLAAVGAFAFAVAGCGGSDPTSDEAIEPGTFLAFETNFRGFHGWESFAAGADPIPDSVHTTGPRRAYLNRRPAHESTEFPVGTIIVKELEGDDPLTRDVVARVKRGGTYNSQGARGWEWFELRNTADGGATILWRGVGPPVGGSYLGNVGGGCNACHKGTDDNVSVLLPALNLANF